MPYKIPADSVLLLEGGAMRGVYTSGVLDVLMQNDLYFPTVAAVSAAKVEKYRSFCITTSSTPLV